MKKAEKFKRIREDLSIIEYASRSGFTLVRKGKYYSLKEHDSVMIDPVKNVYWQNSKMGYGKCIGKEGSIIDFAVNFNRIKKYKSLTMAKKYATQSLKATSKPINLSVNCRRP